MSNNIYKEWLDKSIQVGYIHCYSESDIDVRRTPIASGAYGVVFKATVKHTGVIIAMKTLVPHAYDCEKKLYKKFVREVRRSLPNINMSIITLI